MSKIFIIVILITGCLFSYAQPTGDKDQQSLSQGVKDQGNQMGKFFIDQDYKNYLKYIHPLLIKANGGESKMIELLANQQKDIKNKGVTINGIVFNSPSEIIKNKNELQCTISQHTELKSAKRRVITYTTLIAISKDNGKNWKFIDTSNKDIETLRKLFPNLSNKIALPPKQKPTVYNI